MFRLKANKASLYTLVGEFENLPPMRRVTITKAWGRLLYVGHVPQHRGGHQGHGGVGVYIQNRRLCVGEEKRQERRQLHGAGGDCVKTLCKRSFLWYNRAKGNEREEMGWNIFQG